jgi:ABC-2 type transport system permease protein
MTTRPLSALIRKDLLLYFSDPRAVIVTLAMPVLLASFMAIIFGGMSDGGGGGRIPIIVADEDQSALSAKVFKGLESDEHLAVRSASRAEGRQAVLKGNATAAIVVPKGFGQAAGKALFGATEKPELTVLRDPAHGAEAGMIRGYLMQHVMQAVSENSFSGREAQTGLQEALADLDKPNDMPGEDRRLLREALGGFLKFQERWAVTSKGLSETQKEKGQFQPGLTAPFETKEEAVVAGNQTSRTAMYAHSFSGMAVQFILFGAIEAGVGLLTERKQGLWKRIRSAPLSRGVLLGARTISAAILALLTVLVVFVFGGLVFGLRLHGSIIGFALIAAAFALTAAALGLLIAALGKTPGGARGVSILVVLLMVMLGGAWMPSFVFPQWLQKITPIIPTRWAVDGFDGVFYRGFTLVECLGPTLALLGFAALFGLVALFRFRWEAE